MPHAARENPLQAVCGVDLTGAKEITEDQARVFLDDRRCHTCFPTHLAHNAGLVRRVRAA
jgi:hypothetical protein